MTTPEQQPDGYIVVSIEMSDGPVVKFRTEWHSDCEPSTDQLHWDIFATDSYSCETIMLYGEQLRSDKPEWIPARWVKVPAHAYLTASWNYYTREQHEAEVAAARVEWEKKQKARHQSPGMPHSW